MADSKGINVYRLTRVDNKWVDLVEEVEDVGHDVRVVVRFGIGFDWLGAGTTTGWESWFNWLCISVTELL
jgi:hypothetical protein